MQPDTTDLVDEWWCGVLDVEQDQLWQSVTARHHTELGDYPGWYVATRDAGVHVSAPHDADPDDLRRLESVGFEALSGVGFWRSFADERGLRVIGPARHAYLDEDPGSDGTAPRVDPSLLGPLRASVTEDEWEESGFASGPQVVFGCFAGGELVAAANLTDFAGRACDVGLLVRPDHRGRGLGHRVGGAAASYAVSRSGLARWRATTSNRASLAIARELGFEEHAAQLALRP